MASKNRIIVPLESSAKTGHRYYTTVNPKNQIDGKKLELTKYDPVVRKHVTYKQGKKLK